MILFSGKPFSVLQRAKQSADCCNWTKKVLIADRYRSQLTDWQQRMEEMRTQEVAERRLSQPSPQGDASQSQPT